MQFINTISEELNKYFGSYIALGNFDGVHLGHQELINKCVTEAKQNNIPSIVYTFFPHPEQVILPKVFKGYITPLNTKKKLLKQMKVDALIIHQFTKNFSSTMPEDFIKNYLVKYLKPKKVFVGFNFTFGKEGSGNPDMLKELGEKYNFEVYIAPPVLANDIPISSSRIRICLKEGNIIEAKKLLGYWPILEGNVVSGDKIGRELGFPTANIQVEKDTVLPRRGVYATFLNIDNTNYKAVTNIGYKPTFQGKDLKVETFIINYSGRNLYGENLKIGLVERIRNEKKFNDKQELIEQINMDIKKAINILNYHVKNNEPFKYQ